MCRKIITILKKYIWEESVTHIRFYLTGKFSFFFQWFAYIQVNVDMPTGLRVCKLYTQSVEEVWSSNFFLAPYISYLPHFLKTSWLHSYNTVCEFSLLCKFKHSRQILKQDVCTIVRPLWEDYLHKVLVWNFPHEGVKTYSHVIVRVVINQGPVHCNY